MNFHLFSLCLEKQKGYFNSYQFYCRLTCAMTSGLKKPTIWSPRLSAGLDNHWRLGNSVMAKIIIMPRCSSVFFHLHTSLYLREDQHHHCPSGMTKWEENEDQSHRLCWKAAKSKPFQFQEKRVLEGCSGCRWGTTDFESHQPVSLGHFQPHTAHSQFHFRRTYRLATAPCGLQADFHLLPSFRAFKVKDFTGKLLGHDSHCSSSLTSHPPQQTSKPTPAPTLRLHLTAI